MATKTERLLARLRSWQGEKIRGESLEQLHQDSIETIESLLRYGQQMREVCQRQSEEIERLDPTRPRAEAE